MSQALQKLRHQLAKADVLRAGELVVAINDPDRSTPSGLVVSMLQELRDPGLSMRAVVSCGTHVHHTEQRRHHEQRHLQGVERVHWHSARDPQATEQFIGNAPILAIGSVEPHYFAGWAGAHKTLTAGLWSRKRIEANHRHAIDRHAVDPDEVDPDEVELHRAGFMAGPARTDGNPVFEDLARQLAEWEASRTGAVLAINLVMDGSTEEPMVVAASFGSPMESLAAVTDVAERIYIGRLDQPADRLIATVEPPLSRSLYQALKGVENHALAVRSGGVLVLEARCEAGVGIDHFTNTLKAAPNHAAVVQKLEDHGYSLGDHKALRLRYWTDVHGLKLAFVSEGLLEGDAELCGARLFRKRESALQWGRAVAPGTREHTITDAANRVTLLREPEA